MNLAGALALIAMDGEAFGTVDLPAWLWEASGGPDAAEVSDAIEDFRFAMLDGQADDLMTLLVPTPIDEWVGLRRPGLPAVGLADYRAMREGRREVAPDDPERRRMLAGPHLEALPIGDRVVVAPQNRGSERLTVDVLMPLEAPLGVRLATLSAQLERGPSWNGVAVDLHARAQETAERGQQREDVDCEECLIRRDGRWTTGCAPGSCAGECEMIDAGIRGGVEEFGCVCSPPDADRRAAQARRPAEAGTPAEAATPTEATRTEAAPAEV